MIAVTPTVINLDSLTLNHTNSIAPEWLLYFLSCTGTAVTQTVNNLDSLTIKHTKNSMAPEWLLYFLSCTVKEVTQTGTISAASPFKHHLQKSLIMRKIVFNVHLLSYND